MARKKEGKTVHHNIARVQNCIEKCFMLYMNKAEVMNTVITQAHENPDIAEIVWHRLETQNPEFFKAYNLMVLVKQQMVEFNRLLSKQAELMCKTGLSVMTSMPMSNGYDVSPANQSSMWRAEQITRPVENANLQPPKLTTSPNAFSSGLSIQSCMQGTLDVCTHGGMIDVAQNMVLPQNSKVPQALNGTIVETEPLYNGNLPFNFPPHNSFFESCPRMGDAMSSFTSVETNTQPLNGSILDGFGFLDQNPGDFVLPELAADFSDLLEGNYISQLPSSKDANNLVNSHGDMDADLLMDSHGDMDERHVSF
ncbi:Hypothetical predicted protein [Olea europaea subsp. europaea]|uniref:Uncharacterized protein n=1 Tax=Olea europaea subsp. europaea TaxID=158383 RepID=A0A8S0S6B4_OLEEU|nr:Hypothetical predicted protein [Olea europaea subsp. europaea]